MGDPFPSYATGQRYYTGDYRIADKSINGNERNNYYYYLKEQIDIYGQQTDYFTLDYKLSAHDGLYGEDPNATYLASKSIVMYVNLSEQSVLLSKFGIVGDDDVTAYISISSFYTSMSSAGDARPEPKSGDVFMLTEYGDDRPGDRGAKMFEITQRLDQEVTEINPLMGHYVWLIKGKRLDYTFQPGLTAEKKSDQVYDNAFSGRLSGYTNEQTDSKSYTYDVDTESATVFDYSQYGDNDDVYGDYL
tara:strand:+ start:1203 stop:1943 length:741 start_codon:yes stop_codon:yes gene_type:complete